MNNRWTMIWKGSGLLCTVALFLVLGILLVPHARAIGEAQANLAPGAKAMADSDWSALGACVDRKAVRS